jgi:nucleoside-diphosphate-sugar epimerase
LDTVIARPGHIYGPTITTSDNRASAQFTRNAVAGEDIVLKSAGSQLRSYCYVLDCASAILTVLINGETGNAYNISNPNSIVTISDIAKALANAANKKVVYDEMSELEKKGANMMTNSSLNSKKLEALGWSAEFSLEEGTRKTVEILKE